MDERINRAAVLANLSAFDLEATKKYIDGSPHIKHASLRALYAKLAIQVYDSAKAYIATPRVLDLGAGEGSVTLTFLELGAKVTAVDISKSQLDALQHRCQHFGAMLDVRCQDIGEMLRAKSEQYDIVVANSFLHHVPDYVGLIKECAMLLTPWGQFFSFQDPLRYDSLGRATTLFSIFAYLSWRVLKGDAINGFGRRLRRSRGVYLEDSVPDNAEYHVTRSGVDQDAICDFLKQQGFDCTLVRYFSTQSHIFHLVRTAIEMKNTFAVIAQRRSSIRAG